MSDILIAVTATLAGILTLTLLAPLLAVIGICVMAKGAFDVLADR
ncbi:MAG TPA: hypothetical protein VMH41_16975 [Mycobacteriales bacterium]|nr:hypothetical protein [Mycobacteriales bacterium]